MHELEIMPEDGTPSVSFENIIKLIKTNGYPVAVTHIITPKKDHVTKIFFFNGKSHIAEGLAIGLGTDIYDKEILPNVLAFEMVIDLIPGLSLSIDKSILINAGHEKEDKEIFKNEKNIVYHFIPPDKALLKMNRNCDGMIAFEQSDEILKEEENDIRICDYE